MIPTKRKKRSGLCGIELNLTVQAIKTLINKWRAEEAEEAEEADDDEDRSNVVQLEDVLNMLTTKLDGPQTYSFSSMTGEHLKQLKISLSGVLKSKVDSISRAAATDSIGESEHWSADGLLRHLYLLQGLVPRKNEAAVRLWINAFFFRVASMSTGDSRLVLSVEQNVLPVASSPTSLHSLSGYVDFTVFSTTKSHAEVFVKDPSFKNLSAQDHALFVTEAKGPDQLLENHVSQAICEMYACAKHLEKRIIRGAVTKGYEWIFLILILNEDGNGGQYFQTESIIGLTVNSRVSREGCSLITAIIAHWLQHSHEELGSDDYFTTEIE